MLVSVLSSLFYQPSRRPAPALADRPGSSMDVENRRGYYRIHFPAEARPRLLLDSPGSVHPVGEVIECSERGLRFAVPTRWLLPVGTSVSGRVLFLRGAEAHVAGTVIRMQQDEVALMLGREGIPLSVILDEQRYLRSRYASAE
ncbi:MAG TPA: PilZ domain-containing protein [Gemmatimonadaceae bacterium]|nr:PilZ domain-containing protein [Gemmatimonadaceae bacterium]